MRRTLLPRFLRSDAGLTAVEYAVVLGLIVLAAGSAALWLGRGVHRSSGRADWSHASAPSGASSQGSSAAPHRQASGSSAGNQGSPLPWALLSLGISLGGAGAFLGWLRFRDSVRQGRTLRRVRHSLANANGQAAIARLARQTSRAPVTRLPRPDTHLIGRHVPELHLLVRGRHVSATAELADAGIMSASESARIASPGSAVRPAAPVAG